MNTSKPQKHFLSVMLVLSLGFFSRAGAQTSLDNYISEGLKKNIVLEQKNLSLDKAINALKEAKTYFLPAVNFNGSYTTGENGRNIAFPIGDLLNPVYSTLNKLTQTSSFPHVENVNLSFFPNNFYDAHVRTSMALYNSDLYYNKTIKGQQIALSQYEIEVYKRELVKDIKVAYFNYLQALAAVQVYQSALGIVNKNVEVNKSLLKNGKGLPARVLRAESEVELVRSQITEAQNNANNAMRYFNFLLNKKLDDTIDVSMDKDNMLAQVDKYLAQVSVSGREELKMAAKGEEINTTIYKMNKDFWLPKLSAFFDLGTQASNFDFNKQSRYYLTGLTLDIPIFNWHKNDYKILQVQSDLKSASLGRQLLTQQLQLSADVARNNLETNYSNYKNALKQMSTAQTYYKLIDDGYREGINSQIEYLDARNQYTASQILVNIMSYKVLQAMAAVERETASYLIQK